MVDDLEDKMKEGPSGVDLSSALSYSIGKKCSPHQTELGVVHAVNLTTQEVEAGGQKFKASW